MIKLPKVVITKAKRVTWTLTDDDIEEIIGDFLRNKHGDYFSSQNKTLDFDWQRAPSHVVVSHVEHQVEEAK